MFIFIVYPHIPYEQKNHIHYHIKYSSSFIYISRGNAGIYYNIWRWQVQNNYANSPQKKKIITLYKNVVRVRTLTSDPVADVTNLCNKVS